MRARQRGRLRRAPAGHGADAWAKSLAEGGPKALATTKDLLRPFSRQAMSVEELARGERRAAADRRVPPRADGVLRQEARAVGARRAEPVKPADRPADSPMNPIVGIGEVLWDVYPDGRKVAGGAPFNFAFHCHQLGHPAVIVSRVGDDDLGRELRERVRETRPLATSTSRRTATTRPARCGDARRERGADVHDHRERRVGLHRVEKRARIACDEDCRAVCFGTPLASGRSVSRSTIQRCLSSGSASAAFRSSTSICGRRSDRAANRRVRACNVLIGSS